MTLTKRQKEFQKQFWLAAREIRKRKREEEE